MVAAAREEEVMEAEEKEEAMKKAGVHEAEVQKQPSKSIDDTGHICCGGGGNSDDVGGGGSGSRSDDSRGDGGGGGGGNVAKRNIGKKPKKVNFFNGFLSRSISVCINVESCLFLRLFSVAISLSRDCLSISVCMNVEICLAASISFSHHLATHDSLYFGATDFFLRN